MRSGLDRDLVGILIHIDCNVHPVLSLLASRLTNGFLASLAICHQFQLAADNWDMTAYLDSQSVVVGMSSNIEEPDSSHYDRMHHYVNVTFHQHKEEEEEERKPALPPRLDKTRLEGTGGCGAQNEYEKIKEREDDLERIHKRSRELIRGHFDGASTNNTFRPARHALTN